jgi:hypothetical protein
MTDREFLIWIHQRLANVHGEDEYMDYMRKLRAIIAKTPANKTTPNDGAVGNNLEDLLRRLEGAPEGNDITADALAKLVERISRDHEFPPEKRIVARHATDPSAMDRSDLTSFGRPRTPPPWKLPD